MFKQCPECGQEYQHWVTRCTDCDVALVLAGGETLGAAPDVGPEPEAYSEPLPDDCVLVRLGEPGVLHALAEALQQQGISSWIGAHPQLGLGVRRADLDAARAIADELMARSLPDLEEMDMPAYDASSCPACGTPTPESAAACAECGLEFPEADPSPGPAR
jgi:hypothetical protein